uniref:Uncharacterized protein n=1 Tax=Arion vulgaris TaxID=1028688 RepID=A0A0B6ZJH7_9EUPU
MTKVRTILAEFCSPKEILAINRLGLIKSEERESQPIPWRHRLPNGERRALVLSEMRMSLRPPSKLTNNDKVKAVSAARNSLDSKMGECLVNNRIRQDPNLGSNLARINREERRMSRTHQQARKTFMKRSKTITHEPLILVERSPSDHTIYFSEPHTQPTRSKLPGYMKPVRGCTKTPSVIPTIEAFTMETRKKRNLWEGVLNEKVITKFKSATLPSIRLSEHEISLLKFGHMLHKPNSDRLTTQHSSSRNENPELVINEQRSSSVFLTQLSQKDMSRYPIRQLSSSVPKSYNNN